ncbi:MAG: 3-isopropylmalate dehydratase small subunit [Chloroflexi bacterium]|nr:3-isopropylmalate dehydratase small subunit [Chloroflexota bacterium]
MSLKGKAFKYGSHIDTDAIIPARHLNLVEPADLAKHCMEDIDAGFVSKVKNGDIIVADINFGCGSSREHAPVAIKASGISCVIAKSFARIFFRNAINIGLPLLECKHAAEDIKSGDTVEVDLTSGSITNLSSGKTFTSKAYPEFMMQIVQAGGLVEHTKKKLSGGK